MAPLDNCGMANACKRHAARNAAALDAAVARAATVDSVRNKGSLAALAATGARTVLTGHGEPWTDGIEAAVAVARAQPVPWSPV